MSHELAVITVTHNSGHVIGGWLDALEATGHRKQMEVCVVDSGSTAAERAVLAERVEPHVDAYVERPNVGYGSACNTGAEHTTAPLLLFTNPDTRIRSLPETPGPGQIVGALKQLEEGGLKALGFQHYRTAGREAQELVLGGWARGIERTATSPAWVSGAALLIGRTDFERLLGFSPEFFMYFEDADLCARHRAAGGTIAVDAGFLIEHGAGRSSATGDTHRMLAALDTINRLSARTFAARHGHAWQRPLLYLLLAVAYLPRRCVTALLGRHGRRARVGSYALDLLLPRRAMARLGVPRKR